MSSLLFELGHIVATPGVLGLVGEAGTDALMESLRRHATGDWGDVDAYTLTGGYRIWIVTEADRSVTTFLLPEEY
jgi:hypothetical protein